MWVAFVAVDDFVDSVQITYFNSSLSSECQILVYEHINSGCKSFCVEDSFILVLMIFLFYSRHVHT